MKITSRDQAIHVVRDCQSRGLRVGFTSGAFDILHAGHVQYLEEARRMCDYLVVGLNSDASVRSYKGALRPITPESARAAVIAALGCVDLVFVFDERNNNANIELLKPNLYIKASDYDRTKLSSASMVEAYGGKVAIVPFKGGFSTSSIIERIVNAYAPEALSLPLPKEPVRAPAVFLDRDGTLMEHVEYISEPEKVRVLPKVVEAVKLLKEKGYWVIVVTNQPGIGLGYFTREDFFRVNRKFLGEFTKQGAKFDKIYFCPHSEAEGCECRKPLTGLIRRACEELPIDMARSFVIGDTTFDLQMAKNAGCKGILVRTGLSGSDKRYDATPDLDVADLLKAAEAIPSIQ
ncbi:MAG: HAD-IIIA family hydrolase [Bdellovibrionota bacterium]|nr:MAG: HAD-IIIA family hydrolase [Bdellovibrionota bacterium]